MPELSDKREAELVLERLKIDVLILEQRIARQKRVIAALADLADCGYKPNAKNKTARR